MNFTNEDHRDLQEWLRETTEVEKAPLAARKEAAAEYQSAMADTPDTVGERVGWLIAGNYGRGWWLKARQVLAQSKRANKVAQLSELVAAAEWHCPGRLAVAAWKKLTPAQKTAVDAAIQAEIAYAETHRDE